MSTLTDISVEGTISDDAHFQSWAQDIDALLTGSGWVHTTDTGQADLSAAVRPASNAFAGYKVYKLNDSLATAAPVFMRVDYGMTSTTNNNPKLKINLGTGSNGSGTLTGRNTAATDSPVNPNTASVAGPAYAVKDEGLFAMFFPGASGTGSYGFSIERFRDDDGTPNGDGIQAIFIQTSSTVSQPIVTEYTISYTQNTSRGARNYLPVLPGVSTGVEGDENGVFPCQVIHGKQHPPSLAWVGAFLTDLGAGVTMDIQRYGQTRTYKQMAVNAAAQGFGPSGGANYGIAMLWD